MKKKSTWILVVFLANLALLPFAMTTEGRAQGGGNPLYHCCKKTPSGDRYCCGWCRAFIYNCKDHKHCERPEEP